MIDSGVNGAVFLAMGIALYLVSRQPEDKDQDPKATALASTLECQDAAP